MYASVPLNLTIKVMEDHHLALSFALRVILAFNQCDHHHRIIFKIKYFLLKFLYWNTFWIRVCKTNWIKQYVFSVWKLNFDSVRLNKWRRHWEAVHVVTERYHSCSFKKKKKKVENTTSRKKHYISTSVNIKTLMPSFKVLCRVAVQQTTWYQTSSNSPQL